MNGVSERMTKEYEPTQGATFTQPGRSLRNEGDEKPRDNTVRSKKRNAARDAAINAAKAVRANQEVEDKETAEAIRNARKEARK